MNTKFIFKIRLKKLVSNYKTPLKYFFYNLQHIALVVSCHTQVMQTLCLPALSLA